jgi:predicted amidophosphoribosyltransferase
MTETHNSYNLRDTEKSEGAVIVDFRDEVLKGARQILADGGWRSAYQIVAQLRGMGITTTKHTVNSVLFKEGKCECEYDESDRTYALAEPTYDYDAIDAKRCGKWAGQDLAALYYPPLRYQSWGSKPHAATCLILNFKNNQSHAVKVVSEYLADLVNEHVDRLLASYKCSYIVSLPRSKASAANEPCERVCAILAQQYDWLTHLPRALSRTHSIWKSSQAQSIDERPGTELHLDTINYTGPRLQIPGQSIIMVDDVITHGHTSEACRRILQEATGCYAAVGLFVARTE